MLYFGYGSNLDAQDLARWAGERGLDATGVRLLGPAHLPDHSLAFHYRSEARGGGALDVVPAPYCAVPGALFEVDTAGERALDQKEGAPHFYERRQVVCLDSIGRERRAITYVVTDARVEPHHVPPTAAYLAVVRRGLKAHGLSTAPLEAAARSEPSSWPGRVFVYGSLRSGQSRARLLTGPHTRATVTGTLHDLGAYPGLDLRGSDRVVGESVATSAAELEVLDDVEDFLGYGVEGSLYRRVLTALDDGRIAWTYVWLGAPGTKIAGGDWAAHFERRSSDLL